MYIDLVLGISFIRYKKSNRGLIAYMVKKARTK